MGKLVLPYEWRGPRTISYVSSPSSASAAVGTSNSYGTPVVVYLPNNEIPFDNGYSIVNYPSMVLDIDKVTMLANNSTGVNAAGSSKFSVRTLSVEVRTPMYNSNMNGIPFRYIRLVIDGLPSIRNSSSTYNLLVQLRLIIANEDGTDKTSYILGSVQLMPGGQTLENSSTATRLSGTYYIDLYDVDSYGKEKIEYYNTLTSWDLTSSFIKNLPAFMRKAITPKHWILNNAATYTSMSSYSGNMTISLFENGQTTTLDYIKNVNFPKYLGGVYNIDCGADRSPYMDVDDIYIVWNPSEDYKEHLKKHRYVVLNITNTPKRKYRTSITVDAVLRSMYFVTFDDNLNEYKLSLAYTPLKTGYSIGIGEYDGIYIIDLQTMTVLYNSIQETYFTSGGILMVNNTVANGKYISATNIMNKAIDADYYAPLAGTLLIGEWDSEPDSDNPEVTDE
jgi:hypothetical protein